MVCGFGVIFSEGPKRQRRAERLVPSAALDGAGDERGGVSVLILTLTLV